MSSRSFSVNMFEAGILWKFLDGVSTAVSGRMVRGSQPGEENLTFLLCELLDANTTSLHVLPYPLSQLQADLENSDGGISLDVTFETHEHSKHIESKYSGADLGIVLSINHPLFGSSRRGLLVQAKRLFGKGKSRDFGLFSDYSSFDRPQAEFLKVLQGRFGVWNSVYYLWYNPPSVAFPEDDSRILRAYEAQSNNMSPFLGRIHPFMDELIESGFPWIGGGGGARLSESGEDEGKAREWRRSQPALRISDLDVVLSLTEHGGLPALKALYDSMLERRSSSPSFCPFADFFLLAIMNTRFGSSNSDWVRLAEGKKVPMPKPKPSNESSAHALEEMESPPTPRHTLKLTVRSTLPNVG